MMKGVFLFTARTRGWPHAPRSNHVASKLLPVALLLHLVLLTQVCAQDALAPAMLGKSPAEMGVMYNEFDTIATVIPKIHTGLGWFTAELGDLNGDGFDDYAVTSSLDTTFIFYGGVPLPVEPRYFVLGGSGGVAAGDFNGDGYVDLATTVRTSNVTGNPDPERRGLIRVYYNTKSDPPFRITPDAEIRGPHRNAGWGLWSSDPWYQGIMGCDYNGDGRTDLLVYATHLDTTLASGGYKYYMLFFGGDSLSLTPSAAIHPPARGDGNWHYYEQRRMLGDLNGDGCTDVMILGTYYDDYPKNKHTVWDIWFGNHDGTVTSPGITEQIGEGDFWLNHVMYPALADLNNDGCDELIGAYSPHYGNAPYCNGRPDISRIQTDDSLLNPAPTVLLHVQFICPVGDVNGDGTRDVLVSWVPELFRTTSVYFLYANRSGAVNTSAHGSFGVDIYIDWLQRGAWPVGDVNGDGYDDVIVVGQPPDTPLGNRSIRFRIYGGNSKLVTVDDIPRLPESMRLSAYPNPVHAGQSVQLLLHSDTAVSGEVLVFDTLGRELRRMSVNVEARSNSWPLSLDGLLPGMYSIVFRSATRTSHTSLLVL
jgi:hypothetical protein